MTEGPSPRDPRNEPAREPLGGPDAPVDQPPPDYRPADTTPGAQEAPRWESPGAPPPPPPQGGTWDPGPSSTPPPPPPPAGDPGWGQQGQYGQPPGGFQPGGQYPGGQYPAAGSGMAENVASGLSYVLTWLTGLIFFLVDKRPEVRFHAMQSIAYGVLWTLVAVVRPYMPGPIGALFGIVLFAFFIGWIVLMIQGFQGRHFKLPVIGDFAEQQAGRPGI
ncbi:MAG TPA: hypothetical protein VHA34_01600 [Actinomycetes bacterium]|nr:hypothetical protein [Actinomycetes bacterium]